MTTSVYTGAMSQYNTAYPTFSFVKLNENRNSLTMTTSKMSEMLISIVGEYVFLPSFFKPELFDPIVGPAYYDR